MNKRNHIQGSVETFVCLEQRGHSGGQGGREAGANCERVLSHRCPGSHDEKDVLPPFEN